MKKEKFDRLSRREFFAAGGGLAYFLASKKTQPKGKILSGIWNKFDAASNSQKSKVALVRTNDRTAGVKKCLELLNINQHIELEKDFLNPTNPLSLL